MTILLTVITAILSFLGTYCYRWADGTIIHFLATICVFIQIYLIILIMAREKGPRKFIPIAVAVVTWVIAFLVFPSEEDITLIKDLFGLIKTAVYWAIAIPLMIFFAKIFFGGGQKKTSSYEEEDTVPQRSFGDSMPDTLFDDNNCRWEKDYAGPNIARYHCNSTGQSVELIEESTQYYGGSEIKGSDGRTYHFH